MRHIYTAKTQPATAWVDRCGEVEFRGGWEHGRLLRCQCCWKKRRADRCVVQCFYDGIYIWCAEGHGCKHPQVVARKRRREHMNRSLAQQARRLREKVSNV